MFPDNTDPDIVAMKVGLIDITNSTHLSQYKSKKESLICLYGTKIDRKAG